ncbi:hypothetical protein HDU93_003315 [Gonapodya sp. JEL0774]|nr:hypothetical protein HDU93_003315 [Gonapodya sp. JEL0774]
MLSGVPHVYGLVQSFVSCHIPARNEFTSVLFDDAIDVVARGAGNHGRGTVSTDAAKGGFWREEEWNFNPNEIESEEGRREDAGQEDNGIGGRQGPRVLVVKYDALVSVFGLVANPHSLVEWDDKYGELSDTGLVASLHANAIPDTPNSALADSLALALASDYSNGTNGTSMPAPQHTSSSIPTPARSTTSILSMGTSNSAANPPSTPPALNTLPLSLISSSGRVDIANARTLEEKLQSRVRRGPLLNITSKGYVRSLKLNPPSTLLALLRSPKSLELLLLPSLVPAHSVTRPAKSSEALLGCEWLAEKELIVVATTGVEWHRWSRSGGRWVVGKQVKVQVGWYGWSSPARLLLLSSDSHPNRLLLYHFPPGAPFTLMPPLPLPPGPRPLRRHFASFVAYNRCWVVGTVGGRVSLWSVGKGKVEEVGAWEVGDGMWVVGPVVDGVVLVHDVRGRTTLLLDPKFGPLALTTLTSSPEQPDPYVSLADPTNPPPPSTPYLPHPAAGSILFLRLDLPLLARAMYQHRVSFTTSVSTLGQFPSTTSPRSPRDIGAVMLWRRLRGRAEAVKGVLRERVARMAAPPRDVVESIEELRTCVSDSLDDAEAGRDNEVVNLEELWVEGVERPVPETDARIGWRDVVEAVECGLKEGGKLYPSDIRLHVYISLLPLMPQFTPHLVQLLIATNDLLRLEDYVANRVLEPSDNVARLIGDAAAAAEETAAGQTVSGRGAFEDRAISPPPVGAGGDPKAQTLRWLERNVLRYARAWSKNNGGSVGDPDADAHYVEELLRLGKPIDALRLAHSKGLVKGLGGSGLSLPGRGQGSGTGSPRPSHGKNWKQSSFVPMTGGAAESLRVGTIGQVRPSRFLEVARGTNDLAVFYHVYWFLHANGHLSYPGAGNGASKSGSLGMTKRERDLGALESLDSDASLADEIEERKILIYANEVKQFFEGT